MCQPGEAPRDGFDPAVGPTCKWHNCGKPLDISKKAIKAHILEYHRADVAVPENEWDTSKTRIVCRWNECKRVLLPRSIPKHVTVVHLAHDAVRCPVEGCDEWLSRRDALKRHMHQKHPQI